jgi:hypothetical protein
MVGKSNTLALIVVAQDNDQFAGGQVSAHTLDFLNELVANEGDGYMM